MNIYGYIYLIRNRVNGKVYIGQTTKTVAERWHGHIDQSKHRARTYIHKAIRKYGKEAFDVVILHQALNQEDLDEMETRSIWSHDSMDPNVGYNLLAGGRGSSGRKWTPEQRAKASEKQKARFKANPLTDEQRAEKSSILRKYQAEHPEWKDTLRNRLLEQWNDTEYREAQKASMPRSRAQEMRAKATPAVWTEEMRASLSAKKKGVPCSTETKKKLSEYWSGKPGRPHTEEAKQKCRDVANRRWAAHRERELNEQAEQARAGDPHTTHDRVSYCNGG